MANKQQILDLIQELRSTVSHIEGTLARECDTLENALDSEHDSEGFETACADTVDGCMTAMGGTLQQMGRLADDITDACHEYQQSLEREAA